MRVAEIRTRDAQPTAESQALRMAPPTSSGTTQAGDDTDERWSTTRSWDDFNPVLRTSMFVNNLRRALVIGLVYFNPKDWKALARQNRRIYDLDFIPELQFKFYSVEEIVNESKLIAFDNSEFASTPTVAELKRKVRRESQRGTKICTKFA